MTWKPLLRKLITVMDKPMTYNEILFHTEWANHKVYHNFKALVAGGFLIKLSSQSKHMYRLDNEKVKEFEATEEAEQ